MPDSRKIIQNAYILPCDGSGAGGIGTVTVRNDRITSVSYGRARDESPAPDVQVIDGTGKVLLPGFIDLHVHGESLLLDLLTAGEPQSRWQRVPDLVNAETFWYNRATADDWQRMYTMTYFLALRSGVTFLGEFGVPAGDQACAGALEAFQRTELPGLLTLHNADQLERVKQRRNGALRFALALPPAEELTTYNLQASLRLSKESGYPVMVHLGDPENDDELLSRNFGRRSLRVLDEFGILTDGTILVHLHGSGETDQADLARRSMTPVLSPGGAQRRGIRIPPVQDLRSRGVGIALCTDWGPFSHWATMRSMLQTEIAGRGQVTPALSWLMDLTARPAALLGLAGDVGSVSPGMRANLQLLRTRNLELQGALDILPPAQLAHALIQRVSNGDVSDVMVNGEFGIREGTILTYSEEDLVQDVRELLLLHRTPRIVETEEEKTGSRPPEASGVDISDVAEEGFRIVRRGEEEQGPGKILPLDPDRDRKKELPSTVRRVFGEDDL